MKRGSGSGGQPPCRSFGKTGILMVILATAVIFGSSPSVAADSESSGLEAVANWSLETSDGGTIDFHEQLARGPVVVSFWATWCKPCLKEMPALNEMAGRYRNQVTFLAVNTDNSKSVAKVEPLLKAKNFADLIVPLDTGGEVQQLLQVGGLIPFLLLFDTNGHEVYRHVGYKKGDEHELQQAIDQVLARKELGQAPREGQPAWAEAVTASDKFEYSYSSDTQQEIFENWLDVSYQFGGFRTGLMLRSMSPSEEGERDNRLEHRFFEFASGEFNVRAGHFYGIFGRGLVFNAFEDRAVRVDTRLDGLIASVDRGPVAATVFSGTPSARDIDVRGLDFEYELAPKFKLGVSGLTYRPDDFLAADGGVRREWVASVRARQNFGFGEYYFEYGWKKGWEFDALSDDYDQGQAMYGNLNLYRGPVSLSYETSYYKRFAVVSRADGKTPLNRPPSLAREFVWTLLNRAPHNLDANDEKGHNLDLMYSDGRGWTLLASGARIKNLRDEIAYESVFGSVQKDEVGPFKLTGGFGYQDSEGLRQTVVGEVIWKVDATHSWTLQAEHQHVRLGGGSGYDLGAYDQDWFKLEYESAPHWAFAAILETNNKYAEQIPPDEKSGPFPAGQISYTISRGGSIALWVGERQAGYLCSGGVCKLEPAFEGVEVFGVFRY